jgi:hypothetical protein
MLGQASSSSHLAIVSRPNEPKFRARPAVRYRAFGPSWKIQAISLAFMGWGFYMLHGSLQVFSSELSVAARATALSLHSFSFFMGQTLGPIAYGFGIQNVGKVPTLLASVVIIVALGIACARLLRQSRPAGTGANRPLAHEAKTARSRDPAVNASAPNQLRAAKA